MQRKDDTMYVDILTIYQICFLKDCWVCIIMKVSTVDLLVFFRRQRDLFARDGLK